MSTYRILCHDGLTKRYYGYSRVGRVEIGDNVFVGADSVILPNVKIGTNIIIGSSSIVTRDIPDNCVAAGNPRRPIKSYNKFITQNDKLFAECLKFEHCFEPKTPEEKSNEYNLLKNGGFDF